MTDSQGQEWVKVRHPASGGETEVTKEAYEEVYKEKGWELVEDEAPVAPEETDGVPAPRGEPEFVRPATDPESPAGEDPSATVEE